MILIIGGAYQGKLEFAKSLLSGKEPKVCEGANAADGEMKQADIIAHFDQYVDRLLKQGEEPAIQVNKLISENPGVILAVTELGCGIVPAEAADRQWREAVGRICCALAREAEAVYRITCGIGMRIK